MDRNIISGAGTAAGTGTYTMSASVKQTAYSTYKTYRVAFGGVNTGAATLNIDSLGAITIKKLVNGAVTDVAKGDIQLAPIYTLTYNGTFFLIDLDDIFGRQSGMIQGYSTITRSGAAYTGNLSNNSAIDAYVDGGIYMVKANTDGTIANTLDLNSIGAKPIRKATNPANTKHIGVTLDDIQSSRWYQLIYQDIDSGGFYITNPEYQGYIVAEYDFSADGGAVSTISLTSGSFVPSGAVILINQVYFEVITPLTSSGNANIQVGFGSGSSKDVILSLVPIPTELLPIHWILIRLELSQSARQRTQQTLST